jgi:hypothetical protein
MGPTGAHLGGGGLSGGDGPAAGTAKPSRFISRSPQAPPLRQAERQTPWACEIKPPGCRVTEIKKAPSPGLASFKPSLL